MSKRVGERSRRTARTSAVDGEAEHEQQEVQGQGGVTASLQDMALVDSTAMDQDDDDDDDESDSALAKIVPGFNRDDEDDGGDDDNDSGDDDDAAMEPAQQPPPARVKHAPATTGSVAKPRGKNTAAAVTQRSVSTSSADATFAAGIPVHSQDDDGDEAFEQMPFVQTIKKLYEKQMGSALGASRQKTFTLPLGVPFPSSEGLTGTQPGKQQDQHDTANADSGQTSNAPTRTTTSASTPSASTPSTPSPAASKPRNPFPVDLERHPLCRRIVEFLAKENLDRFKWNGSNSKTRMPMTMIAKLLRGTKQDTKEVVDRIEGLPGPWGAMGSKHPLHSNGDYDYTTIGLAFLLHNFSDDEVPREVKYNICTKLMPQNMTRPVITVPRSPGVLETENHLLMLNGSLYLFHIYATRTRISEAVDVSHLKAFLFLLLKEVLRAGPWAFNSRPFLGHFLIALLVLHESCEPEFRHLCCKVLDFLVFCFALGSIDFRRRAPFRRKSDKAGNPGLMDNALSAMSLVWAERAGVRHSAQGTQAEFLPTANKSVYAIASSYCPHPLVLRLAARKTSEYYARLGHGPSSSPELFAAGPGWLLAAGGAGNKGTEVVAGPTVLMLQHDGAHVIQDTFTLKGKGKSWKAYNNTGLLFNFAVTNGTPRPPPGTWPHKESAHWSVYMTTSDATVVTYSNKGVGILAVFDRRNYPASLLDDLVEANGGELGPKGTITIPSTAACMALRRGVASFSYDVTRGGDAWVITQVNGRDTNTRHATWPLIDIEGRWHASQTQPTQLQALFDGGNSAKK